MGYKAPTTRKVSKHFNSYSYEKVIHILQFTGRKLMVIIYFYYIATTPPHNHTHDPPPSYLLVPSSTRHTVPAHARARPILVVPG